MEVNGTEPSPSVRVPWLKVNALNIGLDRITILTNELDFLCHYMSYYSKIFIVQSGNSN